MNGPEQSTRIGKISLPPGPQADALRKEEQLKWAQREAAETQEISRYDSMSLGEVIQNARVSPQQKRDWSQVKSVKFPRSEKVQLVSMIGGVGLDTGGEQDFISTAMKKPYPNLKVEPIRYEGPSGNAVDALRSKVQSSDKDTLFVLFLSGHGNDDGKTGSRHSNYVFIENSEDGMNRSVGIKTDTLTQIMKTNPTKQFLLIVDSCHSGSTLDEPIANLPNVTGILASSEMGELSSGSKGKTGKGLFTNNLFTYIEKGMPLGEAFIRADLKTMMQSSPQNPPAAGHDLDPGQNPGMIIKDRNSHKILVSGLQLPKIADNA